MDKVPQPNLLERALSGIAPAAAQKRFAARLSMYRLELMARDYDGASRGRGSSNWRANNTSANAEIDAAGAILRARMRDLVRNNPIAANAVQVLVANLVGAGIRPRAATRVPAFNAKIDDLWKAFSDKCDFFGHTDFHGLTALAAREMIEGGDVFALRRMGKRPGQRVPLQVELKEADHLDDTKLQTSTKIGALISAGIEYDDAGRRSAYWLYPDHPGDRIRGFRNSLQSVRVPASQIAHLFERQRAQDRGVPWGAPVMRALRDIDDWQRAELVRKKTEACLVAVLMSESESTKVGPELTLADGTKVQEFSPGMIATATGAEDIKFNTPSSAGGVYEWHRVQLHIVAAGFRVPYALLTGDLSQANFASSRVGLNDFRRMIDMMQWQMLIPMFCQPVWDWFVEAAQLAGDLPPGPIAVEWAPPRFESVNPLQDAQADLLENRAGYVSTPMMIAKRGYDPLKVLEEQRDYLALLDAAGMVIDSDPRMVAKSGAMQAVQDASPPAADGSTASPV